MLLVVLPYKIDESNSNLDGGVYNDEEKTITWTISKSIEMASLLPLPLIKSFVIMREENQKL